MSKKIKVKRVKSNYEDVLDFYNKSKAERPQGSPMHESNIVCIGATGKKDGGGVHLGEDLPNVMQMFKQLYGRDVSLEEINKKYNETFVFIPALGQKNEGNLELEIGFEAEVGKFETYGKDKKVNLPIDIPAYLKYLVLKTSPFVAFSESEVNAHHTCYIVDESTIINEQEVKMRAKLKANTQLLKLQNENGDFNLEEVKKYLYLLKGEGMDFGKSISKMKPSEYSLILNGAVEANPELFLKVVADKEKDIKYDIELLIAYDILTIGKTGKISNQYDEIGTMNDAIKWFKDKTNQSEITVLKQKLEDKQKANLG